MRLLEKSGRRFFYYNRHGIVTQSLNYAVNDILTEWMYDYNSRYVEKLPSGQKGESMLH